VSLIASQFIAHKYIQVTILCYGEIFFYMHFKFLVVAYLLCTGTALNKFKLLPPQRTGIHQNPVQIGFGLGAARSGLVAEKVVGGNRYYSAVGNLCGSDGSMYRATGAGEAVDIFVVVLKHNLQLQN